MRTPPCIATCPTCGTVQTVRREGDVWRTVQHVHARAVSYRFRCKGGTVTHDAVIAAMRDTRDRHQSDERAAEGRREAARKAYNEAIARIDRDAAQALAAVVAYDRALAELDATRPAPPPPKPAPPPREVVSCPVIFLDVDGVLVTNATFAARWPLATTRPPTIDEVEAHGATWLDAACVARLNALCADTGAELVVVSSWRRMGLDALRRVLAAGGVTATVRDVVETKFSADWRAPGTRAWLDERDCARWVVIDDEPARHWSQWDAGRIVAPRDGLTDDDVAAARAVLTGETQ